MALICKNLAMDATYPLPFFVMTHIFLDIATKWDERAVSVDEAKALESKLMGLLENLITVIKIDISAEDTAKLCNSLVSTYLAASL